MTQSIVITPDVFQDAIHAARNIDEHRLLTDGLGAPIAEAIKGRAANIWEKVEAALVNAYRYGAERAAGMRDAAIAAAEDAIANAGSEAAQLQAALLDRVAEYSDRLLSRALAQLSPSITAGAVSLDLVDVVISRRMLLSGSLKASITELVALTGEGELTVSATYGRPRA